MYLLFYLLIAHTNGTPQIGLANFKVNAKRVILEA